MSIVEKQTDLPSFIQQAKKDFEEFSLIPSFCKWNGQVLSMVWVDQESVEVREFSMSKTKKIGVKKGGNTLNQKKIEHGFFIDEEAFILTSNPLQLHMIHHLSNTLTSLSISEQLTLLQTNTEVNYPHLYIFGTTPDKNPYNIIYSLHLQTLQLKKLNSGEGYAPQRRTNYLSLFSEGRLYLFGGKELNGEKCDNLFWTYDYQKFYWFALELKGCENLPEVEKCQIIGGQKGKILIINKEKRNALVLQLYQSCLKPLPFQLPDDTEYYACDNMLLGFNIETKKLNVWQLSLKPQ